jgi:uncharacterized repeat protein (TIGR03803 family)
MIKLRAWKKSGIVFLLCVATALVAPAQTFTSLVRFKGSNGEYPSSPLVQGQDGSFYGTTEYGGANNGGEAFRISTSDRLRIYSFCSQTNCLDGGSPDGLVLNTDGSFYGTAEYGGVNAKGTVFKITPKGSLTTLYSFCPQTGCADGSFPIGLVLGDDGIFYGTTAAGGTNNDGTVFKITPAGLLSTLYSFCSQANCADGLSPNAGMIQARDGNFYGTTYEGGENESCGYLQFGCGTVFKITPQGALTILYRFCSSSYPDCPDGNSPRGGLVQAADGSFYGSTYGIALETGGTIFNITTGGALSTLYTFCSLPGCADGQGPTGEVVQATDGNLYGTTLIGGLAGGGHYSAPGTIFELTAGGVLTTLYNFCSQPHCDDGGEPIEGLMQGTNGLLYGSTLSGGGGHCDIDDGCGTVFSLDAGLPPFVTFVRAAGKIGQTGGILGQSFTGTTNVSLNGIPASFTVVSDTFIRATVPAGATTGYVTVTTPRGTLTSNVPFHVIP